MGRRAARAVASLEAEVAEARAEARRERARADAAEDRLAVLGRQHEDASARVVALTRQLARAEADRYRRAATDELA